MQKAKAIYQRMQAGTLAPEDFTHIEHIRLAWYYLNCWDEKEATERFSMDLRAFTAHIGAQDKYHHTITVTLMRLMASHFPGLNEPTNWQEFKADAEPLFIDAYKLLGRYYTAETLNSKLARSSWQEPDLKSLPAHSH